MPTCSPALEEMIRRAENTAAAQPNMVTVLVDTLNAVIPSAADPYLVSAALIEGLACTVVQKIPLVKQGEMSVEVVRLLRDRLHKLGTI